jgi:hypothetical protein
MNKLLVILGLCYNYRRPLWAMCVSTADLEVFCFLSRMRGNISTICKHFAYLFSVILTTVQSLVVNLFNRLHAYHVENQT